MFQGAVALNVDAKGRLAIPARHRDALVPDGAPLVVTAHPHKCLLIYPQTAWEPIRERITAMSSLDAKQASLRRLLVGFAQSEELDAAGRVLLAPSLRQWAGIDKQVWLVGQGTNFELWSDAGWQSQCDRMLSLSDDDLSAGFENLVL